MSVPPMSLGPPVSALSVAGTTCQRPKHSWDHVGAGGRGHTGSADSRVLQLLTSQSSHSCSLVPFLQREVWKLRSQAGARQMLQCVALPAPKAPPLCLQVPGA